MTTVALEDRIARLEAIEDIRRLKALYCLHCDRDYDPDALAGLFTDDAVWDAGPLRGVHSGRGAIRAFFATAASRIPYAAHLVTNPVIDVDLGRGTATGIWRMLMPCELAVPGGTVAAFQVARYDEDYVMTDEGWRIRTLTVRLQRLSLDTVHWVDLSKPAAG